MKKVLFATTALIATASVAAAEVRLSGYGRFGLDWNDSNSNDINDAQYNGRSETSITSRLRLQFDMSAETDGGVAFGARFRAQAENRDGNPGGAGFNGAQFHVAYEGLRVNVGNIWGAIDNAPGLYLPTRSVGTGVDGMGFYSLPLLGTSWDSYSSGGTGVNGVEALYTAGGFVGHISFSSNNDVAGTQGVPGSRVKGESRTGVMLTYNFGDYFITGAYQSSSDGAVGFDAAGNQKELNDGIYLIAAGGDWGQWGAQIAYGQTEAAKAVTLAGNVDIGAASNLVVWVQNADSDKLTRTAGGTDYILADAKTGASADGTSFGINYQYDLGGGTTFVAGYVDSYDSVKQFQAGVYFNF